MLLAAAAAAGAAVWFARPRAAGGPLEVGEGLYAGDAAALDERGLPRMKVLAALPDDLAMPGGAQKRSLITRTLLGQVEIKAEYEDSGILSESSEWMAERLRGLGWRESTGGGGQGSQRSERVFYKSGDTLYLCLKPTRGRVTILAVIRRAAQRPSVPQGE